jgi:anti-sigma-K factor RskA
VTGPGEQDLKEQAAAYALGALSTEEARAFEAYLSTSAEARQEVASYREVSALLATSVGPAAPAADLKARVIAHATRQQVIPLRPPRTHWGVWMGLAATVVGVVVTSLGWNGARRALVERDSTIAGLARELDVRSARLAQREATLSAILEPTVTLTNLVSTQPEAPVIQLFWNRKTNVAIVHAFRLNPSADQRVYQLWFIPKKGAPIPSVTFNTEADGHTLVQQISVPVGVDLAAAAITDEPDGGSPAPTTTPILVGTFGT